MTDRLVPRVGAVQVELIARTHHVDEDEPDASGMVAWRYEYDLLTLRAACGLEAVVRTYSDDPRNATLLRFSLDGQSLGQGDVKTSHPDALAALTSYLVNDGFESVRGL